jgi:hypothetical protein
MATIQHILRKIPKESHSVRGAAIEGMSPPVFQFLPIRLDLTTLLSKNELIPTDPDNYFATPVIDVLAHELFNPLKCHAAATSFANKLGDKPELLVFQPVLIPGDDVLISNVLTAYVIAYKRDPCIHLIGFTWYVVPTDVHASNEIAAHLGSVDPIYHKFVETSFLSARQIGPVYDDDTFVEFDSILGEMRVTSTNPWLADPSPSNLFQFSLYHYLTFAQSATLISVWRCVLNYRDRTCIAVPWIISVRVGDAFSKSNEPGAFPKAPIAIQGMETLESGRVDHSFGGQESQLHSFAAWNVNRERQLKGNEGWVVAEWTREKDLKTPETRLSKPSAFVTKTVSRINVESAQPFNVMIDQRLYTDVCGITITPLEESIDSPSKPGRRQIQIRFATFNPPM